jgi:nicotinamide-nucleotide amidase
LSYQSIIVTIGDELLIGQTIDTNSAFIAQQLNKTGIQVKKRIAVADDRNAILDIINESISQADILFLTGGLGPTADDITKPLLSEYFESPLVVNETVLQHVKQIFSKRNRPFLERNLKQAEVPENAKVLFNRLGTAPGMWFEKNGVIVISLPGVPFEMQTILVEEVMPRLVARFNDYHIYHKTLMTVGIGESFIAEKIEDIETTLPSNIHLAYLPTPGFVKLRLTSEGNNRSELEHEVDIRAGLIKQRLGDAVAADEDISLEQIVASTLKEHRLTLAFAESCTGGYVASQITNLAGSSAYFKGSIVSYSNEVKENLLNVNHETLMTVGAVSEATVKQMAETVLHTLKSDIALSISGILGPDGATDEKPVGLVWMAICNKDITITKEFHFFYDRLRNKELASNAALNMIRMFVAAHYS